MAVRDTGWIQLFAENGQDVVDNMLCAFRITADKRVLLPVMVHLDGFHLTHMIEPIYLPDQEEVDRFLPPYDYAAPLDVSRPATMGVVGPPYIYTETKQAHVAALDGALGLIRECWDDFARQFGRTYRPVEAYRTEGARTLLLTMGSYGETAMEAVDRMRGQGQDVGLVRLRLWRPFPFADLRAAVRDAEVLIVLDRAVSPGGPGGPVAAEVRSALFGQAGRPKVVSIIGGLGGRDIDPAGFARIVARGEELAQMACAPEFEIYGVRE